MTKPTNKTEYEISIKDIRDRERITNNAKRQEVISVGGSCLTCKNTRSALGVWLICKLKAKKVKPYNYCERYIAINFDPTETKDTKGT